MKSVIGNVIKNLEQKTHIHVNVYDMLGGLVFSTGGIKKNLKMNFTLSDFCDGIYLDKTASVTWFVVSGGYIGAIEGVDAAAKNYAYMISALIESAVTRSDLNLSRSDAMRSILTKESSGEQIRKYMRKYNICELPCCVVAIRSVKDKQGEILNLVNQFVSGITSQGQTQGEGGERNSASDEVVIVDGNTIAYVMFLGEEDVYHSAESFAEVLYQSVCQELNIAPIIGVGTTCSGFSEIASSFEGAQSAIRMSTLISVKSGVFSYREYLLLKILEELPSNKLNVFIDSLCNGRSGKEILKDKDIISTGEEFLNCNLNLTETSKNLFMHRNTLIYRLDKIENAMGLDLRKFSDAVTFRIITLMYKLIKSRS